MLIKHLNRKHPPPGGYYLKLSGLVGTATEADIKGFLGDCAVKKVTIVMTETTNRPSGKRQHDTNLLTKFIFAGVAAIEVASRDAIAKAERHDREYYANRFVRVQRISANSYRTMCRILTTRRT